MPRLSRRPAARGPRGSRNAVGSATDRSPLENAGHDGASWAPPRRPVCIFYARGYCRNGPTCPYRHEGPVSERPPPRAPRPPRRDRRPRHRHAPEAAEPGSSAVGAVEDGNSGRVSLSARSPPDEDTAANAGHPAASQYSDDDQPAQAGESSAPGYECGICFENPQARNTRYGILVGCNHPFCLSCIKRWRSTHGEGDDATTTVSHRRTCPVCRAKSDYIIPSFVFGIGDEKARILENYRAGCAEIPCKYFTSNRGDRCGVCPFGSSCFYKHVLPDGTVVEKNPEEDEIHAIHSGGRREHRPRHRLPSPPSESSFDEDDRSVRAEILHDIFFNFQSPELLRELQIVLRGAHDDDDDDSSTGTALAAVASAAHVLATRRQGGSLTESQCDAILSCLLDEVDF